MIPLKTIEVKHSSLGKDLPSGELDNGYLPKIKRVF